MRYVIGRDYPVLTLKTTDFEPWDPEGIWCLLGGLAGEQVRKAVRQGDKESQIAARAALDMALPLCQNVAARGIAGRFTSVCFGYSSCLTKFSPSRVLGILTKKKKTKMHHVTLDCDARGKQGDD